MLSASEAAREGREVVVNDFEGGAGVDGAAGEDGFGFANVGEDLFDFLEDGVSVAADHEGEHAGLCAHGSAGDGGVDEGETTQ